MVIQRIKEGSKVFGLIARLCKSKDPDQNTWRASVKSQHGLTGLNGSGAPGARSNPAKHADLEVSKTTSFQKPIKC